MKDITPEGSTVPIYQSDEVLEYEETPPTPEQIDVLRQTAYQQRSDPLYFKWQRGEATEQEWLDEVEAIRLEYPLPEPEPGD